MKCDRCRADIRENEEQELPSPDPKLSCFSVVCPACFVAAKETTVQQLIDERRRLQELITTINQRVQSLA